MKSTEYDDLLPVALFKTTERGSGQSDYLLLDKHNDLIATFDRSMEFTDMERIVKLINREEEQ